MTHNDLPRGFHGFFFLSPAMSWHFLYCYMLHFWLLSFSLLFTKKKSHSKYWRVWFFIRSKKKRKGIGLFSFQTQTSGNKKNKRMVSTLVFMRSMCLFFGLVFECQRKRETSTWEWWTDEGEKEDESSCWAGPCCLTFFASVWPAIYRSRGKRLDAIEMK